MNDFNRKVESASARVSKTVADATERLEKEIPEFIKYLNDEVVPAVRTHSTKASARSFGKAGRVRRLHGTGRTQNQIDSLQAVEPVLKNRLRLRLVHVTDGSDSSADAFVLAACGHPKQAKRQCSSAP